MTESEQISNRLLLTLALVNLAVGFLGLLVIFIEGYSLLEATTSIVASLLGGVFIYRYYRRTQQLQESSPAA